MPGRSYRRRPRGYPVAAAGGDAARLVVLLVPYWEGASGQTSVMRPRVFALVAAATLALGVLIAAWGRQPAVADFASDCQSPTAVYPDANGMPSDLNLDSTQVVLFASDTFSGSVNSNLGTICVAAGAAFQPSSINGASRSFVRGTALMPALAAGPGAVLDNEGNVRFLPQPNTNGVITVINRAGATIVVDGRPGVGA